MPTPTTHLTFWTLLKPAGWVLYCFTGGNYSSKRNVTALSYRQRSQARNPAGHCLPLWPPPHSQVLRFADLLPELTLLTGSWSAHSRETSRTAWILSRDEAPLAPTLTHQGTFELLG